MTIDPRADRPVYKQLADLIRTQIERGDLAPGQRIPAEHDYVQQHGISRDSVRRAMAVLRGESLITTNRRGSYVRDQPDRKTVRVDQGTITARMPTESERRDLNIHEGVPVIIIVRPSQREEFYSADRTVIVVSETYPW